MLSKLRVEQNLLNFMKVIYEKLTSKMIFNTELLTVSPLKLRTKENAFSYHL